MPQNNHADLKAKLRGVLPPIAMPFNEQGELVKGGLKPQIDFYYRQRRQRDRGRRQYR